MIRNKVAAAMAGAALVVALHGGVASADDGSREPSGDPSRISVLCSDFGLVIWTDDDGNGTYDTPHHYAGCGMIRGHWTV